MENVFFIPFPKPITQPDKCKWQIRLCGRPHTDFNVSKVNKYTYICSVHFVSDAGPTEDYPDPISAVQIGSQTTPVVKKSRKLPRRLISDSAESIVSYEHNYATFSASVDAVTSGTSTDDLMDISFCKDEKNNIIRFYYSSIFFSINQCCYTS